MFHQRCARFFLVLLLCGFAVSSFAGGDQGVTVYKPNSNGKVNRGCAQVVFVMTGVWTGTIGNAAFSNATATQTVLPISAVGDGQRLGEIPYTIAGAGSLIICEVR
jgi:hypothetical protein